MPPRALLGALGGPRESQESLRHPKGSPRSPSKQPKEPQGRPRQPQESPNNPHRSLKSSPQSIQEGPKTLPDSPQEGLKRGLGTNFHQILENSILITMYYVLDTSTTPKFVDSEARVAPKILFGEHLSQKTYFG